MEISEVRVKLVANQDDRLKAFCSMTLDNEFVIRDVKIIEGTGGLFVAMPSRKMSDHCGKCGGKNHLRAKFCTNCGSIDIGVTAGAASHRSCCSRRRGWLLHL